MGKLALNVLACLLLIECVFVRCRYDRSENDIPLNAPPAKCGSSLLQMRQRHSKTSPSPNNSTAKKELPRISQIQKVSFHEMRSHLSMGKPSDIGNWEPLIESGFQNVAATCCYLEMEKFIRRLIDSLDLDVCDEAGLVNLLPQYTTCTTGESDINALTGQIMGSVPPAACPFVAARGGCPNDIAPECQHVVDSSRRRQCTPRYKELNQIVSDCPLPEGAIWCKTHLKNASNFYLAVYDWDVSEDWVSYHICQTGYWEADDMSAFGDTGHMLDIGANVGFYVFALAQAGWNVTAFEPQASNLALMNATLCRNPHLASKIRIHNMGLGSTQQECGIKVAPNNVGDGHVVCEERDLSTLPADYNENYMDKNRFQIRRLDDVLQAEGVEHIDLVKMDVEGYELQVLHGAASLFSKYHPRRIKSEVWGNMIGGEGTELLHILDDAGYKYYRDNSCENAFDAHAEVSSGFAEIVACLPPAKVQVSADSFHSPSTSLSNSSSTNSTPVNSTPIVNFVVEHPEDKLKDRQASPHSTFSFSLSTLWKYILEFIPR